MDGQWQGEILSMDSEFLLSFETHGARNLMSRYKSSQSDSALLDGKWDSKTGSLGFLIGYPHSAEKLLVTSAFKEGKVLERLSVHQAVRWTFEGQQRRLYKYPIGLRSRSEGSLRADGEMEKWTDGEELSRYLALRS